MIVLGEISNLSLCEESDVILASVYHYAEKTSYTEDMGV
jgi:hypothetical protein